MQVMPEFAKFCEGAVLVAHNAGFDTAFFAGLDCRVSLAFAQAYPYGDPTEQFAVPSTWHGQTGTYLSASDFEGFHPITKEQALSLGCPDPNGSVRLFYAFDGNNAKCILFYSGVYNSIEETSYSHNAIDFLKTETGAKFYYTNGIVNPLRFGSSDPAVVSYTNGKGFKAVGAGTATLYAVFDGDDDYQDDSAFFTVTIANPATLTLAANDDNMGTVSALLGGESTLLTTINASDNSSFTSGSQTFDGVATVTLEGEYLTNGGSNKGWYCQGNHLTATVTVNPVDGYTIDSVKFYCQNGNSSAMDTEAPFMATVVTGQGSSDIQSYLNGIAIGNDGITKIEVYGAAGSDSIVATASTLSSPAPRCRLWPPPLTAPTSAPGAPSTRLSPTSSATPPPSPWARP